MQDDSRDLDEQLDRYIAGECTEAEMAEVRERLAARPGARRAVETVVSASTDVDILSPDFVKLRQRVMVATTSQNSGAFARRLGGETRSRTVTRGLSVTALIVVGVLAGLLTHIQSVRSTNARSPRLYTTAAGQLATVVLADGSRALLGPATTLSVTRDPARANIDVSVNGQALFTTIPARDRLFRVHTGHAVASVLGTTFLVRQYSTDHIARIVVTEGRVALSGMHGSVGIGASQVLTVGMLGTVNDSGRVQVIPKVEAEDYTGWTTGQLVFRDTPARDAAVELGRAYGVEIRIADSTLAAQLFNWKVTLAQRSLTEVLEALADALDAHAVRTGRVITLVPGRSPVQRQVGPHPIPPSESRYGR